MDANHQAAANTLTIVNKFRRSATALTLALAIGASISIMALSYAPAAAQETFDSGRQFGSGQDGPYLVTLYGLPVQPTIAKFGFTVTIESLKDSALVTNVVVEVVAFDPQGEPEWLSPALSFPPVPTSYVGNASRPPNRSFTQSGDWLLEIRVDGPEGESVVGIPITVAGAGRGDTGGAAAVFALALGAIVVVATALAFRIRRDLRRRAKPDEAT